MANIDEYVERIRQAKLGEEVRGAIANAIKKVNDDNESYNALKEEVKGYSEQITQKVDQFSEKIDTAERLQGDIIASGNLAQQKAEQGVRAVLSAREQAVEIVQGETTKATNAIEYHKTTAIGAVDQAIKGYADSAKESAETANTKATEAAQSAKDASTHAANANASKNAALEALRSAERAANTAGTAAQTAETAKNGAVSASATAAQSEAKAQQYASEAATNMRKTAESEQNAKTYSSTAVDSASKAESARAEVVSNITKAVNSANTATEKANEAGTFATKSENSATNAKASEETAVQAKDEAVTASETAIQAKDEVQGTKDKLEDFNAGNYPDRVLFLENENKAQADEIDRLTAENKTQAFQIADLNAAIHEGIIDDEPFKFENLTQETHPTHIQDENGNYHKVIEKSECEFVSMEGKSVVSENLLVLEDKAETTISGVTYSIKNGRFKVVGTASGNSNIWVKLKITIPTNKSVYVKAFNTSSDYAGGSVWLSKDYADYTNRFQAFDGAKSPKDYTVSYIMFYASNGTTYNTSFDLMVVEGSVAPTEFKRGFDGIKSVLAEGVKINGQNIWDEQWEVGMYDNSTGVKQNAQFVRNKYFIPVRPNTDYFFRAGIDRPYANILFYDKNKQFISALKWEEIQFNKSHKTPNDCYYINFNFATNYGLVYNHDIAIILGTQGSYTPYKAPQLIPFGEPIELPSTAETNASIRLVANDDDTFKLVLKRLEKYTFTNDTNVSMSGTRFFVNLPNCEKPTIWKKGFTNIDFTYSKSGLTILNPTIDYKAYAYYDGKLWLFDPNNTTDRDAIKQELIGKTIIYEPLENAEIILADNLTENQVAALIERYGSVEVVGNTNEEFVKPDVTMLYQVLKTVEQ